MKIFFLSGLGQGGAERQVIETANILYEKGIKVKIMSFDLTKKFYSNATHLDYIELDANSLVIRKLPKTLRKFIALLRIGRIINKEKPDYVISYITKLNATLGIIGLMLPFRKTVFIASERTTELRYIKSKFWRLLCKFAYLGIDGFYTNNTITKERMSKYLGIDNNKIFILRNLINTDLFRPKKNIEMKIKNIWPQVDLKCFKILVVGRICQEKNQKVLIDVCKILKSTKFPNFQFIIAGDNSGKYATELSETINNEKLRENFVILGKVSNIIDLYRIADITLIPSLYEGFPNVLLEAMSCESLVVTTNVSDVSKLVQDKKEAFILKDSNPETIASKLHEIKRMNESDKQIIKKSAREKALRFGKNAYFNELINILEDLRK